MLLISCTFWLGTEKEFGGFVAGYLAFTSVILVLNRFAEIVVASPGKLPVKTLKGVSYVLLGGFFKFLFPPLIIFLGIKQGFSIIFMALGLSGGLTAVVIALWVYNHHGGSAK